MDLIHVEESIIALLFNITIHPKRWAVLTFHRVMIIVMCRVAHSTTSIAIIKDWAFAKICDRGYEGYVKPIAKHCKRSVGGPV